MENLKLQYRDLEQKVLTNLRERVNTSKERSKHIDDNCIKVNIYNYTELAIINDHLTFLDDNGLHYSLWAECDLEDLIDVLNDSKE
jgi:hypothetical protein